MREMIGEVFGDEVWRVLAGEDVAGDEFEGIRADLGEFMFMGEQEDGHFLPAGAQAAQKFRDIAKGGARAPLQQDAAN